MLPAVLFYVIWNLSSLLTHLTEMTDKIAHGNNFQSWLPLLGFERGKALYPLLAP